MTTLEILRGRYPEREYALMAEVRDKAGFHASRSADFIAVNLWPSRGLAIHGIELKSHRSDWLSEMKKPEKAENIFQYCDYFWLLTSGDKVAKIEEIPEAWGWLMIRGEKIFVQKEAPKLTPINISKHFLCAMLKRAIDKSDFIHRDLIQDRISAAKEEGAVDSKYKIKVLDDEIKRLRQDISGFESAAGIRLDFRGWSHTPEHLGSAFKSVLNGGEERLRKNLLGLEATAKNIYDQIVASLDRTKASVMHVQEG